MRYAPDLSGSPTGSFVTRDSAPAVERYARAVRTAIRPPCPACDHVHVATDARIVGSRFRSPVGGYRARSGGPVRATRAEAVADECRRRASAEGVAA